MKKYVNNMSQILEAAYPDAGCSCYYDFALEEEFLCELCVARLRQHRRKLKHKQRHDFKKKFKEH
jgi:hypothetical protein